MNTRTQTLLLWASSKTEPANPQNWRNHYRRLAVDGNVAYHWMHNTVKSQNIRFHGKSNPESQMLPKLTYRHELEGQLKSYPSRHPEAAGTIARRRRPSRLRPSMARVFSLTHPNNHPLSIFLIVTKIICNKNHPRYSLAWHALVGSWDS